MNINPFSTKHWHIKFEFLLFFYLCTIGYYQVTLFTQMTCSVLNVNNTTLQTQTIQRPWTERLPITSAFWSTVKAGLDPDEVPVNAKTYPNLLINQSLLAVLEWTGGSYLQLDLLTKSNLSLAHLHSVHIKCRAEQIDISISRFSKSSRRFVLGVCVQRE